MSDTCVPISGIFSYYMLAQRFKDYTIDIQTFIKQLIQYKILSFNFMSLREYTWDIRIRDTFIYNWIL